jgi:hypothetical protein
VTAPAVTLTVPGYFGISWEAPAVRYVGSQKRAHGIYALVDDCYHRNGEPVCGDVDTAGNVWARAILYNPTTGAMLTCVRSESFEMAEASEVAANAEQAAA